MSGQARILLAGLLIAAIAGLALALLSGRRRTGVWKQRLEAVTAPYHLTRGIQTRAIALAAPTDQRGGFERALGGAIGWQPERRAYYRLHWASCILVMAPPALAAAWLATRLLGRPGWIAAFPVDVLLTRLFLAWSVSRNVEALLAQFPDALASIARAVRIGVPLIEAVRLVARDAAPPTRGEFARAGDQAMIGVPLETALREMASRTGVAEYRFFATALSLQSQTGGALTETLDNLAETIRKRQAARKRAHALASEARASIYVLAALPIVVGMLLYVINPDYIGTLFTTSGGQMLFAYAVFSLITGMAAMRFIIRRALS